MHIISNLADRYFNMLKPLDTETKFQIVTLLVNSIKPKEVKEEAKQANSLFDLYGIWANDPDGELIEKTIREGRKDPHTRDIASFD